MARSLHDRLRSLDRRGPEAASGGGTLATLERDLVGQVADQLSLKARLERLVAVASSRARTPASFQPDGPIQPLEEIVQGCRVENERGEFFLIDDVVPLETFHGNMCLSRFHSLDPESVGVVAGDPEFEAFDLSRAVFLDTETTGLAGGTGTAAFLIGIGYVDGDRFRLKQYFMRDYHEEAALLRGLGEELEGFSGIVTYNGRMFDVPLLEARYRLNRDRFPLEGTRHLDLLHPARRLWKARFECCRLQTLERELLGVSRRGDVPGEQIPRAYFDFVRRRDARTMARVFKHNRIDVLSLAALAVFACHWVRSDWAEDPRDLYSLARVYERVGRGDLAQAALRRSLDLGDGAWRLPALVRLAAHVKRSRDYEGAAQLWRAAAEAGEPTAFRELAIHHEHRSHDLEAALAVVEEALGSVAEGARHLRKLRQDLTKRRQRLLGKLERQRGRARVG